MSYFHPSDPSIPVRPAATVVIFRHDRVDREGSPPELLMLQRSSEMRFAGGAAVFPGGRVDDADRDLAKTLIGQGLALDVEEAAARVAAVRETLEETGLAIALDRPVSAGDAATARDALLREGALAPVLARMGRSLALDQLVPFARWCPNWPNAFDTRFYLFGLGTGDVVTSVDETENTRLFWTSAPAALAAAARGEISVIFPTHRNLDRLSRFRSFEEACAQAAAFPVSVIVPAQVEREDGRWLTIPEGLGYPVTAQKMETVKRG